MTRINVGISPIELCNEMLIAEYKELPRAFKVRTDSGLSHFRLGSGHVLWCAQFQWSLRHRHMRLCQEMLHRGFNVNYLTTGQDVDECGGRAWHEHDEVFARPLLQERIRLRLSEMKRAPTWTKRDRPEWACLSHFL